MINQQFDAIGKQFVDHYYKTFDSNRRNLIGLYSAQSMLTFEGEQFSGAQNIVNKIASLPFTQVQHKIIMADFQPNPSNNGVIVFVTGTLLVDGGANPLKFAQVFHLIPNPGGQGFYCLNDMFRLNYG